MSTTQTQVTAESSVTATGSSIPLTPYAPNQKRGHETINPEATNDPANNHDTPTDRVQPNFSLARKVAITVQLAGMGITTNGVNGLVVVGLPRMTTDLDLPPSLAFWPVSAAFMATTASLLLAGSLADILGPRSVELVGVLASGVFMIGCGLARQGEELVALRALQGVGLALHLASSVSLVTMTWPRGRARNIAFACLGISSVIGFSLGLVLAGVFVDTIGWRAGWHVYGGTTLALAVLGFFVLPKTQTFRSFGDVVHGIRTKMDIVGALLASAFMAFISYFLAVISKDVNGIREPDVVVFLCLGALSLPLFIYWVHRQVRLGKPALIPNSIWRDTSFSTICAAVAISYGVLVCLELFASLL